MKSGRYVRWMGVALLAAALAGWTTGCDSGGGEDKDDNPGDPVALSGASTLRATVYDDITNIYFDGAYLGTQAPKETRDYGVPTGEHVVKFTNAEKDNQKPDSLTINFQKGYIHPVSVTWEKE